MVQISLPDETVTKLQKKAAARGITIESIVKEILLTHINTTTEFRLEELVIQRDFTPPISARENNNSHYPK